MGAGMDDLSSAFRRNPDGSWICVLPVTIDGPHGPIKVAPGTTFAPGTQVEGLDVAALIEQRASAGVWQQRSST